MTKIVLITPILQHYRLTFYEKLSKYRDDYDLYVLHGVKKKEDGRPGFAGETSFKQKGFIEHKVKLPFELVYNWGMFSEVKKFNPDVVILQGIAGDITNRRIISWAKRNKKKIIIWACAWEPNRIKGIIMKIKMHLVRTFYKKAHYHLTYSNYASGYIKNLGIRGEIIETCYNGIEIDGMIKHSDEIVQTSKTIRDKYNLDNFITFIYVGGLISEKKPILLLNAFKILRGKYDNLKLLIIGDGPERNLIENFINENKDDNIYYLGRIYDGVDPYFAASDCFVLPGSGGLALNQAMFWGKTCIASVADGTEDDLVIEGKTGYRFEDNNLESLVVAMERRIHESPENIEKMTEDAKELILTKSNVSNMVKVFAEAIEKVKS